MSLPSAEGGDTRVRMGSAGGWEGSAEGPGQAGWMCSDHCPEVQQGQGQQSCTLATITPCSSRLGQRGWKSGRGTQRSGG